MQGNATERTDDNGGGLPPSLFEKIEDALQIAQDLAMPPTPEAQGVMLRDELIPALFEARLYVEVGRVREPEVRGGLSRALKTAHSLTDIDHKYGTLVNRLRILIEDAETLAREL